MRTLINLGIRLGDREALLFVRWEVDHLSGDATLLHAAVWRLNEAEVVDATEGCQRADQSDVRTFRRFNWADAAVVAVMHVAHVEAGALAGEAARPEGGEAALAGELGERVRLIHELAQLRAAEELLHRGNHWAHVDERARCCLVVFLNGHALLDHALHAQEANTEGVLDQLTVCAHAAVAKMVGDVAMRAALVGDDEVADDRGEIFARQGARCVAGKLKVHQASRLLEALRELVAADSTKVVAARVKEEVLYE